MNTKNSLSIKHTIIYHFTNSLLKIRGTSQCIYKQASFTVEAAVVLPFFVCFLVFIMYFFRILQVQTGVAQALQYAGRKVAAECYKQNDIKQERENLVNHSNYPGGSEQETYSDSESFSVATMLKARLCFKHQLTKQNCPLQFINGGINGISLLQSDFSGNHIELKAIYKMKVPIHLLGKFQYKIVQEVKCRKWTGYQIGQDSEADDSWLYYTQYGTVYHASRSCTHLDLSIQGIPYSQVENNRNQSGGKYHPCEKCGSQFFNNTMVYITNYGERYHTSLTCSGLKRRIYMIKKSKATEKRMCTKCGNS